ncbi:MAG: carboxypeptidase regulatory-like domain-containing protein [Ignavibacteria bacterium]|jgi:TolB protein
MVKSKKLFFIILTHIFLSLLFSCKEETVQPEMFGSISGIVLDADDNTPIVGASVITSPPTNAVVTDNSGIFEYINITVGNYTITVTKNEYVKNTVSAQVRDGETTSPTILLNKSTSNNTPPDEPSNPFPENNAINQSVVLNLAWSASDPDNGDTLSFDVFLYESNNPTHTEIASEITDTSVTVDNLLYNTTYFWQVIVKDGEAATNGSIWSFTTLSQLDNHFFYASSIDGNYDIYSLDTTSGSTIRLTNNLYRDWWPRLNPNGSKIAYVSNEQVNPQIFIMELNGSNIFRVTTVPIAGYHNNGIGFSWSPDGGQLLYGNYNKLYKIDQFGANLTQIATAPPNRHFRETDWSHAINRIVVLTVGENPYDSEIYLMDSNGSNMNLFFSNLPGSIEFPSFSVDGNNIMFTRDVSGFESPDGRQLDSHIFIMSINGSDTTDVSINKPDGTNDLQPRFSPDGAKIIFVNSLNVLGSATDIWMMDSNGDNRTKIIDNAIMPEWN